MKNYKHRKPFEAYCESIEEIHQTYPATKLLLQMVKLSEPVNVHLLEETYEKAEIEQYRKDMTPYFGK